MKKTYYKVRSKGFTLIELMTAVSVFLIVMTISMGAILGIFNANDKVGTLKITMDNLNLAVETMSREIRFGTTYDCGLIEPVPPTPTNCLTGSEDGLSFYANDGRKISYHRGTSNNIIKSIDDGPEISVTAPEVNIQNLTFYVSGASSPPGDNLQPRVIIVIKGEAGTKASNQSGFTLQTEVSQRLLDNGL